MPRLEIITPEQVVFRYEVAGMISRALACLVDYLLICVGYLVLVIILATSSRWSLVVLSLGVFLLDFSYFAYFDIFRAGQTPGKRLFSLRVISLAGTRIHFGQALIRNLIRPTEMLITGMVLGTTIAFFDSHHRRLGDMAAETVVVRDFRRKLPQSLAAQKNRVNTFQSNRALQQRILTRISREERDLVLDLAVRRDELDPPTRESLFADAARYFREKLALPENLDHLSDEQTVVNLALVVQDAKFTG